jgi:hypothetical protein
MGQRSATIDRDAPSIPLADPGLRPATAEDIERLKAVMAEAFTEDPIYSWLMPNDTKRPARLRRYFAIELRHLGLGRGRVWTSSNLTGARAEPAARRMALATAHHPAGGQRLRRPPGPGSEDGGRDGVAPHASSAAPAALLHP